MASAVSIYIKRGEQVLGPFSEEQAVARYHRGEFSDTDLAMIDGVTGWHPLASYIVDETEGTPASFDSSGSPPLAPREDRPVRHELIDEPRPEPILGVGHRRLTLINPMATAWALLGIAVVVMFLSRWPWTLWTPLLAASIGLAVQQLVRRNFVHAAPLVAVALLLPWFVWSQWLYPVKTVVVVPRSATAGHEAPAPAATPVPIAAPPAPEPPKVAVEPAPATPVPAPSAATPAPERTFSSGDRVVLARNAELLFDGKYFRQGRAGEEFEVLKAQPDKLFLKTKDSSRRVIAVTVAPSEVRLLPPAPPSTPAPHIIE